MVCAEVKFHPMAEAHTCRFLREMKLPTASYDNATTIQAEPPVRIPAADALRTDPASTAYRTEEMSRVFLESTKSCDPAQLGL
eukprot:118351-Amphidinium_carterae.1